MTATAPKIRVPKAKLATFCQRWQIVELALFGSVLRDDFQSESDVDVLARFGPAVQHRFADFMQMEEELAGLFGRKVDLVDMKAVEQSQNPYRKKAVLESAHVVYDAA